MRLIDLLNIITKGNSFIIALGIEEFDYWDLREWYENGEDNNNIPSCIKDNWNEIKDYEVNNLMFEMFKYNELMTIDLIENKTCKTEITLIDLLDKICNHRNNIYFHINDFCDEPFEEIDFLVEKQKIEWNKIKNKPIKNFYISSIDVDDEIKVLLKINLKE